MHKTEVPSFIVKKNNSPGTSRVPYSRFGEFSFWRDRRTELEEKIVEIVERKSALRDFCSDTGI